MVSFFKLNIITIEEEVFSKDVCKFMATGVDGEFQILKNHTPFLTKLVPCCVYYEDSLGRYNGYVVLGGIVDVQPWGVTVFADTIIRSASLDEAAVVAAKENTLRELSLSKEKQSLSYDTLKTELLVASAKLRLLKEMRSWGK